jgi:hypothetical protein
LMETMSSNALKHCRNKSWELIFNGLFEEYGNVVKQHKMNITALKSAAS